jgi:hypothetical protein
MNKSLSWLFGIALVDALAAWLLIIFYLTGIDLVGGVNFAFIAMTVLLALSVGFRKRVSWFSAFFLFFILVAVAKAVISINLDGGIEIQHVFTYLFGLVMPFLALSFTARFCANDKSTVQAVLQLYARRYTVIAFSAICVYSFFYFSGVISYFGLGVNLHYVYPFLLSSSKSFAPVWFFLIILISGKRAVLINYLMQTIVYFFAALRSRPIVAIGMLVSLIIGLMIVAYYSPLLDRFTRFSLDEIDISDGHFMYVFFGGRFEELQGIYEYFIKHPYQLFFGSHPGAFYIWEVTEGSEYHAITKNYSHISIFGLIFRYGIVFGVGLYAIFAWMLFKYWAPKEPLYLVFVGILTSSLFGANLIVDPTSWLFIGLLISVRRGNKFKPVGAPVSAPLRIDASGIIRTKVQNGPMLEVERYQLKALKP